MIDFQALAEEWGIAAAFASRRVEQGLNSVVVGKCIWRLFD